MKFFVLRNLNLLPESSDSLWAKMELGELESQETANISLKSEFILRVFCYPGIKLNVSHFIAALCK